MIKKEDSGFYNFLLFNKMSLLQFREVAAYRLFRPNPYFDIKSSKKIKIKLHKPHPGNILKRYQLDFIEAELKWKGLI